MSLRCKALLVPSQREKFMFSTDKRNFKEVSKNERLDARHVPQPTTEDLHVHFSRQDFSIFLLIPSEAFRKGYMDILTNFLAYTIYTLSEAFSFP